MKSKVRGPAIRSAVVALGIGAFGSGASAEDVGKTISSQLAPSRLAYARLYCTPDHESHFAELTADLAEQNFAPPAGADLHRRRSASLKCVLRRILEAHWGAADLVNHLYHLTPAVQLLTVAAGVFSIATSDGKARQLRAGDVVHLEDVAPCKGHITVVGDTTGFLVFAR